MVLARRLLVLGFFVALLVGGWYFAADNSAMVTVNHPGGPVGDFQLWVALSGSFALGVVLSALVAVYRGARMRLVARRYKKLLAGLQSEVHQLRNLPLADAEPAEPQVAEAGAAPERGS
jgi:uncharacterized integral membrane protein